MIAFEKSIEEKAQYIYQQKVPIKWGLAEELLRKYFTGRHGRNMMHWTDEYEIEHTVGGKTYYSQLFFPQQGNAQLALGASELHHLKPDKFEFDEDGDLIFLND